MVNSQALKASFDATGKKIATLQCASPSVKEPRCVMAISARLDLLFEFAPTFRFPGEVERVVFVFHDVFAAQTHCLK